jgi:hypothetical protein
MIEQLLSITIPVLHPVPPANAGLYLIAEDGPQSAKKSNSKRMSRTEFRPTCDTLYQVCGTFDEFIPLDVVLKFSKNESSICKGKNKL